MMESKTKVLGHPVHTQLIVFPLGLLSTSIVFDLLHLATRKRKMGETSFFLLASGLVGALAAAPFGTRDWWFIPQGTRAKTVGLWHGAGNAVVTGLFGASWLLRRDDPGAPGAAPIALSLAGGALAGVTGWLGGELVYRLRVGVDEGANLDAPSSLSELPAGESATDVQGDGGSQE